MDMIPPSTELDKVIDFRLELDSNKYTYIRYKQGGQEALRFGEKWRELSGDNLIYFMGCLIEEQAKELSTLRIEYQKALEALKEFSRGDGHNEGCALDQYGTPDTDFCNCNKTVSKILSTPYAIAVMKGGKV